ncbi:zinc-dependent alcohol dehydrogenase [Actinoplanes aureus]|uniref:Alcohol dehydrogenase catalytic domain-containing protein n=1 Tax=Actinoplanes aureus TaxID=2792083 RepID=A0A931FX44_9ACTN|nr:alcohol dehydrogenase catalytic domain-containing protein [Actinoplanes aureus]MBG0562392.1 alcohol dehydrogenase catalytic domain-containing protein [Actinoplanes aureus]
MRAVLTDLSIPRYLLTAAAQTLPRGAGRNAGWGVAGLLSLRDDLPEPVLPDAPGWVLLRPELAGICGSDTAAAHAKSSPVLSAYYSARRQIFGHEIVAVVTATGPGVTSVRDGDRVAVDPVLSCAHRGFEPCRSCRDGFPYVCERFDEPGRSGCHSPTQGFDAALGGGWGEYVVAHQTQLHPVGAIPSRRAVLAEPASIALHAALRWTRRGDRAVVIGPGTIGLLLVAALRRLHPDLDITVVGPGAFSRERAMSAGANRTLEPGPRVVEALAREHGGRVIRPRLTRTPILEQGVDVVFDCVALSSTLDLGLHLLRPTGMLVLVGSAGRQRVDWSLVWNRQLTVQGTVNSGPEPALDGRPTMAHVVEWLGDPAYPADGLVTHVFELPRWREALVTASAGPRAGAVKVTLRPNPDLPLLE